MRIGTGYDVHRLAEGRPLVLGGMEIPFEKGLAGHSDADVLIHAIMDALYGAAGLGDIGQHFPDSDPAYRNISSLLLLRRCREDLLAAGYEIENIDSTVIAQAPRILPYLPQMRARIADALDIDGSRLNIKATTEEGLGFTGEGLGIAAQAVALLRN